MKEPVDHILRPRLPWRDPAAPAITECGYDASKVTTITRDEYAKRRKNLGYQRTGLITCMTCSQAADRWAPWEVDPRKAVEREIAWEGAWRAGDNRGQRLRDELVAIAALIAQYPEDFKTIMANVEQRRSWLEQKAAREPKPPSPSRAGWRQV